MSTLLLVICGLLVLLVLIAAMAICVWLLRGGQIKAPSDARRVKKSHRGQYKPRRARATWQGVDTAAPPHGRRARRRKDNRRRPKH